MADYASLPNKYISTSSKVANHFEQKKNIKAGTYTAAIVVLMLLLCFTIGWTIRSVPVPIPETGIEVNLGNSDFGSGNVAPAMKGDPAPEPSEQRAAAPPAAQPESKDEEEPDPNDKEPAIVKPAVKPKAIVKPNDNPPVQKPVVTKEPPAPPERKPKTLMGPNVGGTGNGGNSQDAFNNVRNQGVAGGKGDQGKANGNPNSDSYTGNGGSGKGGITVVRGNRTVVRATRLAGEFTQSAVLYVDVKVDENGTGSFIRVTKGINESQYTSIIKQRLASRDIQFNAGNEEIINIRIDFKMN